MRIKLRHETVYEYERPARSVIQLLRLTPRPHEGQHVLRWRIEFDADARLKKGEDALGNVTHTALIAGPVSRLTITAHGEVETWETHGVIRGAAERFAPEVFLRETELTRPDGQLRAFAHDVAAGETDVLGKLHAILTGLHREVAFDTEPTHSATPAAEAFAMRRGVCQDHSHIFIAAAREIGVPARYVSGHLAPKEGSVDQEAAHAWAEAYAPGLGWVGFDVANCVCPTPNYVRVAIGLDYLGAAPVRGSRTGGGGERMDVRLNVGQAARQSAGQSQS